MFEAIKTADKNSLLETVSVFEKALGIKLAHKKQNDCLNSSLPRELQTLLKEREKARAEKNFQKADEIRDKFRELGYEIVDTKEGQCVKNIKNNI